MVMTTTAISLQPGDEIEDLVHINVDTTFDFQRVHIFIANHVINMDWPQFVSFVRKLTAAHDKETLRKKIEQKQVKEQDINIALGDSMKQKDSIG
jgi:hypothetical protein